MDNLRKWFAVTVVCGFSTFISYSLAIFGPLPDKISIILALAFGPFFLVTTVGLYHIIKAGRDSIELRLAAVFCIVATAMLTCMLVVQLAIQDFHQKFMSMEKTGVTNEQLKWMFKEVNSVQLGLDIVWDIFIGLGTFFLAIAMYKHPSFNKIISVLGMSVAILLLAFNLAYFPEPPGEAGSIDFGPFTALWYLALLFWMLVKRKSILAAG